MKANRRNTCNRRSSSGLTFKCSACCRRMSVRHLRYRSGSVRLCFDCHIVEGLLGDSPASDDVNQNLNHHEEGVLK